VILPITTSPVVGPDGTSAPTDRDRTDVTNVVGALEQAPGVPVTLAPRAETIDGFAQSSVQSDAGLASRLASAATTDQVLSGSYVRLDPRSLLQMGERDLLSEELSRAEDSLSRDLAGVRPDRRTWVTDDGLDAMSAQALRELGVDQVLVPESAVTGIDQNTPPTQPFDLLAAGGPVAAASIDASLSAHFTQGSDTTLAAVQLLSELAFVYYGTPAASRAQRGVVIAPPAGWHADPAFLATLLGGLRSDRIARPVTIDDWFRDVPRASQDANRSLVASTTPNTSIQSSLSIARYSAGTVGSMLLDGDPRTDVLHQLILTSVSSDLDGRDAGSYLTAADSMLDSIRRSVEPLNPQHITITSRRAAIPITVTSTGDQPVQIEVRLDSSKLTFPKGSSQLVTLHGPTRLEFPVEARASGTFPLTVEFLTPVGAAAVDTPTRFTVRSTALSGIGIFLSLGAIAILGGWWATHLRRARQARRAEVRDSAARHPASTELPPPQDLRAGGVDAAGDVAAGRGTGGGP
jgi:hypothetical protein